MNTNFEISARAGVGPILFGMGRDDVRNLLGEPGWVKTHREEYLQGFIVHYDVAQSVEFIELANSELFNATFHGTNLHKTIAEEALSFVCQFSTFDDADTELGYSYIFPFLELSLWRSVIPESSQDPDGKYFEAIGVGKAGYYSA